MDESSAAAAVTAPSDIPTSARAFLPHRFRAAAAAFVARSIRRRRRPASVHVLRVFNGLSRHGTAAPRTTRIPPIPVRIFYRPSILLLLFLLLLLLLLHVIYLFLHIISRKRGGGNKIIIREIKKTPPSPEQAPPRNFTIFRFLPEL